MFLFNSLMIYSGNVNVHEMLLYHALMYVVTCYHFFVASKIFV